MSTTRFRGKAEKDDQVRHAQGRNLHEMGVNILG